MDSEYPSLSRMDSVMAIQDSPKNPKSQTKASQSKNQLVLGTWNVRLHIIIKAYKN